MPKGRHTLGHGETVAWTNGENASIDVPDSHREGWGYKVIVTIDKESLMNRHTRNSWCYRCLLKRSQRDFGILKYATTYPETEVTCFSAMRLRQSQNPQLSATSPVFPVWWG